MKPRIILALAAGISCVSISPVRAQDAAPPEAAVIRAEDEAMSCLQIGEEAAALSEQMGGAPSGGLLSSIGGVAKTAVAALVPGGGLVAAGADALTQPAREAREARETAMAQRWYYLNGLYTGRDCHRRAEAAVATPDASAPAVPPPSVDPSN